MGGRSKKDQLMLIKIGDYIGFVFVPQVLFLLCSDRPTERTKLLFFKNKTRRFRT